MSEDALSSKLDIWSWDTSSVLESVTEEIHTFVDQQIDKAIQFYIEEDDDQFGIKGGVIRFSVMSYHSGDFFAQAISLADLVKDAYEFNSQEKLVEMAQALRDAAAIVEAQIAREADRKSQQTCDTSGEPAAL